jgi:hypothetical protein
MDSPAISPDITFLDLGGEPIKLPQEWTEAFVEMHINPDDWDDARLIVNGSPAPLTLRRFGGRVRVIASWPRANAGSYILRTELGANVATQQVTILPGKLTRESFETLLADLETRLPASVAIGLQRAGGLAGLKILSPEDSTVAQELARLWRAVQGSATRRGLAAVLRELAEDPHQILRPDEVWTRTELARRPHPARLMHAVSAHPNLRLGEVPDRIIDQRVDTTVDVYENRLVRLYHDQVAQRLGRLQRQPEVRKSNSLGDEMNEIRAELASARRDAAFLDDVATTAHVPVQVTMVLLKRPAYHAAFEGYLELHRRISVFLDDPRLDLPLENFPALYQLWGTLSTCNVLLDVAARFGYRLEQQHLVRRVGTDVFVQAVPAGRLALRLVHPDHDTVVTLTPERSYGASGTIRSISFSQVPDISITVESPGERPRLLLLDPKYKLDSESEAALETGGRPKKVDIDKMHAYRDAIQDTDGRHVVSAACTIYPGPTVRYADGIAALQGDPSQSQMLEVEIARLLGDLLTAATPSL